MLKKYHQYLINSFLNNFFKISLVFLSLSFILNFFEELKFFDNYNVNTFYPIFLTFLNTPSTLFELFPFIFLISTKFFYIELYDKNEIEILKNNGINYFKILSIFSIISLILGFILIFLFYTFSSVLKNQYYNFKNNFTEDNTYLAVVNEDGLWIKEDINSASNFIHSEKFNKNSIENIIITQTSKNYKNIKTIYAKKANIERKTWELSDVKLINEQGENQRFDILKFESTFTGEIISNLFSNLYSLNIYELHKLKKNYSNIGYSVLEVSSHLNKLYSSPFFFFLMTVLGLIIMIKFKFIKKKFFIIVMGVFVSVLIYYLNYFSSLFGNNQTIPVELSIWLPHLVLFLICLFGTIKINEV